MSKTRHQTITLNFSNRATENPNIKAVWVDDIPGYDDQYIGTIERLADDSWMVRAYIASTLVLVPGAPFNDIRRAYAELINTWNNTPGMIALSGDGVMPSA